MKIVGNQIKNYYELTKPKIWYLLVFTAFGAAISASWLFHIPVSLTTWILLLCGVAAGSAAADTITGYNDRDIDAIMDRTKDRPIPSGRISPKNALIFGLVLAGISLIFSYFINIWACFLMAFGLFDNIIVYSKWLKRSSQYNIILGIFRSHSSSYRIYCYNFSTYRNRICNVWFGIFLDTYPYLELWLCM